jgi:Family of unknown function (DUF6495)
MKYRRLSIEELSGFENEFVQFLIVNGIDASEWQKIKASDPIKAEDYIEIFSDLIFEGIVNKVQYIEYFDRQELKLFKCDPTQIYLTGITSEHPQNQIAEMIKNMQINPASFTIYHTSKGYVPDRNSEIFRMINSGGIVTDGTYYELFSKTI